MAYIGLRDRRTHIYQLLFMSEFYSEESFGVALDNYFSMLDTPYDKEDRDYICGKLQRILDLKGELDELISHYSENWKINRINRTDLCALRLGLFLSGYDDEMPVIPAFVEAVKLAKAYGGTSSGAFVNGILGRYLEDHPAMREKEVKPIQLVLKKKSSAQGEGEQLVPPDEPLDPRQMDEELSKEPGEEEEIDYYALEKEEQEPK